MFDGQRGVTDAGTGGHCRRSGGRIASLVSVLVLACGGMAEGVAPGEGGGDDAPQATASSSPASSPGRPSRNPSGTRSVTCYSPDDLDDSPLLEQVLPFLPRRGGRDDERSAHAGMPPAVDASTCPHARARPGPFTTPQTS